MKRFTGEQLKYLKLLANQYPNINAASTEIINLQAILNLPKGTEHFVSDVHGEFDAFNHVLRNASGVIKSKINDIFGKTLMENEKKALATLIYYPERKLESIRKKMPEDEIHDWYRVTLFRLVKICKEVSTKYTRSKVRKALPPDFSYIIQELIHEDMDEGNKHMYYAKIIDTIISLGRAEAFIVAISNVIHRLAIDRLHVIGDIYDRGDGAAKIMDLLLHYHSLDIQWGNHDISWMGAAAGNKALICNCIRVAARYANLDTIEEDYGINLVPLATFAMDYYQNDPCNCFLPKVSGGFAISKKETDLIAKMHKAITVLQFKMEAEIIKRRPEYELDHMLLLDKMDLEKGTVCVEGVEYKLLDTHFPTIDPKQPFRLTKEEEDLMDKLVSSFSNSQKLQEHTRLLFNKGSMYSVFNTSLLFHGCIPLSEDGSFVEATLFSEKYKGKELMDQIERTVREGYFNRHNLKGKLFGMDMMWYLWCGPVSPLFGKKKVTTFERYFIKDPKAHQEEKNPYYHLRNEEAVCRKILEEFGLDPDTGHIINGHVPVKVSKGEEPIKANGKLYVIDGGFAKAYQDVTGIAGYTLIYNSRGLVLVAHEPFVSMEKAIEEEQDIVSEQVSSEYVQIRQLVMNTDIGKSLMENIAQLEDLLLAYQTGRIKEQE